jgi:hypothetical protein
MGVGGGVSTGLAAGPFLKVYTMLLMVPIKTSKRNEWSTCEIGLDMAKIVAGEE